MKYLSGGHGLGDEPLEGQLLLLQVIGRGVLDLELSHSIGQCLLNLLLLATLQLQRQGGVRDDVLNTSDVGLELLLGLEALGEGLIVGLELLGICHHGLDLGAGELADRVGDSDVGAAARGLLSGGNLENTVDIDLEDDLEDGLASLHGRNRSQREFTQGGVVLAILLDLFVSEMFCEFGEKERETHRALTLEHREDHALLVVGDGSEGSVDSRCH